MNTQEIGGGRFAKDRRAGEGSDTGRRHARGRAASGHGHGSLPYRPEIDGLRAVAVLPVILFHAGMPGVGGGFVGVDVFFVISGYLITSIIHGEIRAGRFSLARFYERRARRILPALFLVSAVTVPLAWIVMMPLQFKDFAQSLAASALFSSNILFMLEKGYFQTDAALKPLMHTWSLAVEEQFYMLFPLLLLALGRAGRARLLAVFALLFGGSLVLAEVLVRLAPVAAYYLLLTRAFELLTGAAAALLWPRLPAVPGAARGGLAALGLLMIALAVALYDEGTPFPGLAALLPVAGAALVILFATRGTTVGRWLALGPVVAVGLVSYSAYLWHQPLFALARHAELTHGVALTGTTYAGLIALTFALAALTWSLIEQPCRDARRVPLRPFVGAAVAAGLAFTVIGGVTHLRFPDVRALWVASKPAEIRHLYALLEDTVEKRNFGHGVTDRQDDGACRFNVQRLDEAIVGRIRACRARHGPGVLVLGDSHAKDLYGMVSSRFAEPFLAGVTAAGCLPDGARPELGCAYEAVAELVAGGGAPFRHVIYEQAGFHLLRGPDGAPVKRELFAALRASEPVGDATVDAAALAVSRDYLAGLARHVPVTWLGPRVEPHLSDAFLLRRGCRRPPALRPGTRALFDRLDDAIARAVREVPGLSHRSQNAVLDLRFPRDLLDCEAAYWSDGDHFSTAGEIRFGRRLPQTFLDP